ncbi:MAG: hypothetical protein IJZ53_07560 [Tyzzerella sp.]|nr:hypothetical protein [Tyzzerella sp.]
MLKNKKLKELENKIFYGDYTDDEWREIDKALDEEFAKASEEDKKAFIDNGAGNMLAMIMEYMD